jgi:hypothetical protein
VKEHIEYEIERSVGMIRSGSFPRAAVESHIRKIHRKNAGAILRGIRRALDPVPVPPAVRFPHGKPRIHRNVWGNWHGYLGTRRAEDFRDERDANEWLASALAGKIDFSKPYWPKFT